jgi:hypothetical protein
MNPHRGQPWYEQAWDKGYQYGYAHPHESNFPAHAPSDGWGPVTDEQEGWLKQVWAEGALEGAKDGLQYGHDTKVPAQHTGGGEGPSGTEAAAHVGGHMAVSAGVHAAGAAADAGLIYIDTTSIAVAAGVGLAEGFFVGALIFLLTETVDPEVTHTDPAELGTHLAHKCSEVGCSEFFLPYCSATGHGGGGSDDIFSAGLWHGLLYYNGQNAQLEAHQHVINERHWGHTGVLHYLPSEPNYMKWMLLQHT